MIFVFRNKIVCTVGVNGVAINKLSEQEDRQNLKK